MNIYNFTFVPSSYIRAYFKTFGFKRKQKKMALGDTNECVF